MPKNRHNRCPHRVGGENVSLRCYNLTLRVLSVSARLSIISTRSVIVIALCLRPQGIHGVAIPTVSVTKHSTPHQASVQFSMGRPREMACQLRHVSFGMSTSQGTSARTPTRIPIRLTLARTLTVTMTIILTYFYYFSYSYSYPYAYSFLFRGGASEYRINQSRPMIYLTHSLSLLLLWLLLFSVIMAILGRVSSGFSWVLPYFVYNV